MNNTQTYDALLYKIVGAAMTSSMDYWNQFIKKHCAWNWSNAMWSIVLRKHYLYITKVF